MVKELQAEANRRRSPAPSVPPLFYQRPAALSPFLHVEFSLEGEGDYGFARATNSIPLNAVEFSLAVRHYPIVFTPGPGSFPVVIVGTHRDRNLFVDAAGHWRDGVYIPAWVRRYPFIFLEEPGHKDFILGIDEAAPVLKPSGENRLFRGGKPTPLLERAVALCSEYQGQLSMTRAFCKALEDEGLLVDKEAGIAMKDGGGFRLTGFRVVDDKKFDKLDSKVFQRFRRRGWLAPIYLHLASVANWAILVDLAAREGT
ncbi:MAG TPA: SapC family protein [Stellaceae bacterium]|nr:SapC family protein [Stellaceae bacterium]